MKKWKAPFRRSAKRFANLFHNPFFWVLTVTGNFIMVMGSLILWYAESDAPGNPEGYLDYLLWSAGIITTIGYGIATAHTLLGKLTLLFLMLFGTVFVWSYMGFLVTGLIAPEINSLERDVHEVEKDVREILSDKKVKKGALS